MSESKLSILMLGPKVVMKVSSDGGPYYRLPYFEPVSLTGWKIIPDVLDMMNCWQEVFEKVGYRCPNCDCILYASNNYMEAPVWVYENGLI